MAKKTHHDHLVEIARSMLGDSINVIPLMERRLALVA